MNKPIFSYLGLSVRVSDVGGQIEAGRVHASGGAGHVISHVGQVALRCRLQISERSTEGHDLSPESQKSTVLSTEVLIEGLKKTRDTLSSEIFFYIFCMSARAIILGIIICTGRDTESQTSWNEVII